MVTVTMATIPTVNKTPSAANNSSSSQDDSIMSLTCGWEESLDEEERMFSAIAIAVNTGESPQILLKR